MTARYDVQVLGATQVGGLPGLSPSRGGAAPSRAMGTINLGYGNEGKELLGDSGVFLGVDGRSRATGNIKRLGMGGADGQGSPPALADQIGGVGVVVGHLSEDGKTNYGPTSDTDLVEYRPTSLVV